MSDSEGPFGVLVSSDLFFTSKVTGTASMLGFRVQIVGNQATAVERAGDANCRCLFLDLGMASVAPHSLLESLDPDTRPKTIAFGSHVHTKLLDAARDAGFDEVMPKSRFSESLPDILRAAFADS